LQEAAKRAPALAQPKDFKRSEEPKKEVEIALDQAPAKSIDKPDLTPEGSGTNSAGVKASEEKADDVTDGSIVSSDLAVLVELLDQTTADALVALHDKIRNDPKAKPKSHASVEFPQLDRAVRGKVHSVWKGIHSYITAAEQLTLIRKYVASSQARLTLRLIQKALLRPQRPAAERSNGASVRITKINKTLRAVARAALAKSLRANIYTSHYTRRIRTRWKL
jgi:hypothetical protein